MAGRRRGASSGSFLSRGQESSASSVPAWGWAPAAASASALASTEVLGSEWAFLGCSSGLASEPGAGSAWGSVTALGEGWRWTSTGGTPMLGTPWELSLHMNSWSP